MKAPSESAALDSLISLPAVAGVAGLVGSFGEAHMQVSRGIRQSLPASVTAAGAHPASARALLVALALDRTAQMRDRQIAFLQRQLAPDVLAAIDRVQADIDALEPQQRMPALLLAFPALRRLTREERLQLVSTLNGMLQGEGRMSLQSYVLRKLAQVYLHDEIEPAARLRQAPLSAVQADIQVLFSVLAQHGHRDETAARRAYEIGVHHLYPRKRPAYAAPENWAGPLDLALSRLDRLAPAGKEQLVEAMVRTVTHDQQLMIGEAELLRAVCATLHCPLPPLVAGEGEGSLQAVGLRGEGRL